MTTPRIVEPSSDEAFELMIKSSLNYKFNFLKNATRDLLKTPRNEKQILEAMLRFFINDEELENKDYLNKILDYSYSVEI